MDPFEVLGLPPTASPEQIRAAFRAKSRRVHPDVGGDARAFQQLVEAAEQAEELARGPKPQVLREQRLDRHRHTPPPPPNVWAGRGGLFWILPVIASIFMLSGIAGPYFLPVFTGSLMVFGLIVWIAYRMRR